MIETVKRSGILAAIAAEADFLSIGTNDLTHAILRADRFSPQDARAHDPRVLRAIAAIAAAAAAARVPLEVCGEAASDPSARRCSSARASMSSALARRAWARCGSGSARWTSRR